MASTTQPTVAGHLHTSLVGIKHSPGTAQPGDALALVRKPSHAVDPNAIAGENMAQALVGYLGRRVAADLAPFIDSGRVILSAVAGAVESDGYRMKIDITVSTTLTSEQKFALIADLQGTFGKKFV